MFALVKHLLTRARRESAGFGMIELLAAMTILVVGVLAVFSMFQSGAVQIRRASTVTTAAALADAEMEKLRAVKFAVVGFTSADVAAAGAHPHYASDAAYRPPGTNQLDETVTLASSGHSPVRTNVLGADRRAYRVDTYISWHRITVAAGATGRNVKLVTIVVRDSGDPGRVWARVTSSFDESTGL